MTDLNKIDPNILQDYQKSYRPYYNYRADYQTDAPSYFDYLGNLNKIFTSIIDSINQQVDYVNAINNKDIKIEDTETIKLLMEGDFKVDNQILLKGRLKISDTIENREYQNKNFDIRNAILIKDDGIYIRDFTEVIDYIFTLRENDNKNIEDNKKNIENLVTETENISNDLGKEKNKIVNIQQEIDKIDDLSLKTELNSTNITKNKTTILELGETIKTVMSFIESINGQISKLQQQINEIKQGM